MKYGWTKIHVAIACLCSAFASGHPAILSRVYSSRDTAGSHTIALPVHVRPGGIAHAHGDIFYVSDLVSGDVYQVDAHREEVRPFSRAARGSGGLGVAYSDGLIFVAGGGDDKVSGTLATLNVIDEASRDTVAQCVLPSAGFVTDVAVLGHSAYWTDAYESVLYRLYVPALPACHVHAVDLPPDAFRSGVHDGPSATGVTAYESGLIVSNSRMQTLFYVDANYTAWQLLHTGALSRPAGVQMVTESGLDVLYVAQPHDQLVSKWTVEKSGNGTLRLHQYDQLQTHDFRNPTDVAVVQDTVITCDVDLSVPIEVLTYTSYHLTVIKL